MSTTLAELRAGESGTITGFVSESQATQRLMQLGVLEGEHVDVIRRAPAGDPIEIRILGYSLSLRGAEASLVCVDATSTK
jgi:ferrous iron transport protein A